MFEHAHLADLREAARRTARRWGSCVSFVVYADKTSIEVISTLPSAAHEDDMCDYFCTMLTAVIKMEMEPTNVPPI